MTPLIFRVNGLPPKVTGWHPLLNKVGVLVSPHEGSHTSQGEGVRENLPQIWAGTGWYWGRDLGLALAWMLSGCGVTE